MSKTIIYNFTDECGCYQKDLNEATLESHPFYVRSNYMIEIEKYFELEEAINKIKEKYGVSYDVEIKWSHYGSKLNLRGDIPHRLSASDIRSYIKEVVEYVCSFQNATLYYTFTDNNALKNDDYLGTPDKIKLISMHLQNAFQRLESEAKKQEGYGIIIADDMNSENKYLKKAMYQLTTEGDQFTNYPHVQKALLVDYSDISCGLQIADLLAGVFTAALKYISATGNTKKRYSFGYDLYEKNIYKIIRYREYNFNTDIYKSGIKEIPSNVGQELSQEICKVIDPYLYRMFLDGLL